jgi:DNA-binding GntR family transcriptional regulator
MIPSGDRSPATSPRASPDGTYTLGSSLPAEDELASEYAVARITVRRALGELRKRKLIKTLPGHRSAVVAMPRPGGLPG